MLVIDELLKGFTKIKKLFSKNLPTTITPSDHLLLSTIENKTKKKVEIRIFIISLM